MIYNNVRVTKPITYSNFSFERASVATYYDEDGMLTEAAVDELRTGYDPETLDYIGPIIEAESTNRLLYSNQFEEALAWELVGSPLPVVTDNDTTGPDGTTSAALFELGGAGTQLIRQNVSSYITLGKAVFSVYVKALVPDTSIRLTMPAGHTSVFRINVGDYDALAATASIKPLSNGWFRCEIYGSSGAPGYCSIQANSGDDFLIYGAMFETFPFADAPIATSYIESLDSFGVRAADIMSAPPAVISTNIPATGEEYLPAVSYPIGYEVVVEDYNRVYRSRADLNVGHFPPTNPDWWVDTGATNQWRMFDMSVGADLQTVTAGSLIDVTVSIAHSCDRLFLFNVFGTSAQITVYSGESIVFDETRQLTSPPTEASWWHWYFDRRDQIRNVMFVLPPAMPATVRVRINGLNAKLGKLVIGRSRIIGFAEYGNTSIGIADYSIKQKEFGNAYIKEGSYKEEFNARVVTPTGQEVPTRDYLASLRAVSSVYSVEIDPYPIMVLGLYNDFEFLFGDYVSSYCSLQVEGI